MRRDYVSIRNAHRMDPRRRELYVEGRTDRIFFSWLLNTSTGAIVREINLVDIPCPLQGGQRARLLWFGEQIADVSSIECFADADFDRLLERESPLGVRLTDGRDLEHYVLREDCVEKALRLGLLDDSVNATDLLHSLLREGRWAGILRLLSERDGLQLPFQKTTVDRYTSCAKNKIDLQRRPYLQTLLQNAGRSLKELETLLASIEGLLVDHASTPDSQLVHGKDAMRMFGKWARCMGAQSNGEGSRLLWATFERRFASDYPQLSAALSFLDSAA